MKDCGNFYRNFFCFYENFAILDNKKTAAPSSDPKINKIQKNQNKFGN